MSLERIWSWRS